MELQCCKVVPTEDGFDMFPSSQWMDANQLAASAVLGIPANKLVIPYFLKNINLTWLGINILIFNIVIYFNFVLQKFIISILILNLIM